MKRIQALLESGWYSRLIKAMVILGWLVLPFTHLRWLPNFGTTRPLTSILFVGVMGLLLLRVIVVHWRNIWNRQGWTFIKQGLANLPGGWRFLRWWLALLALGIVSAALTPIYGNFPQALNRLLGYGIILAYVVVALFSLKTYGIQAVARWTALGYVPVLIYGLVEVLAVRYNPWAISVVRQVRDILVVQFNWGYRLALFTTEASFTGFHLVLLGVIFPYLRNWWLRILILAISLITILFSVSGTLYIMVAGWLGAWLLLSQPRRRLGRLAGAALFLALVGLAVWVFVPGVQELIISEWTKFWSLPRMKDMPVSMAIRGGYVVNLIWVLIETRGLGLGIGQYGHFWHEIFLRHINYQAYDIYGEVGRALASSSYMRPWSVIFGLGADLGLVGMGLFFGFIYHVWRVCRSAYGRGLIVGGLLALVGAYPIVTPHVWLAFALLGGLGESITLEKNKAAS